VKSSKYLEVCRSKIPVRSRGAGRGIGFGLLECSKMISSRSGFLFTGGMVIILYEEIVMR